MGARSFSAAAMVWAVLAMPAAAQQSTLTQETQRLRELVAGQQQELDAQRRLLEELRALVLRQGQAIEALAAPGRQPAPVQPPGAATDAQIPPASQEPGHQQVNPTQEVARETPQGPSLEVGPARIRLGGYLALTGIFRSTNAGGNVSTPFGSIPFEDSVEGQVSETRLSAQSTRISLRVDAPFPETTTRFSKLAGYFEMDFAGEVPGTVAVSSTSAGLRLRQAFGEVFYGDTFQLALGQAFSLMTPAKDQLSVWPSDHDLSQAVDTGYLAGLVWTRSPQIRFTWRPTARFNWAVSAENPEQQVGRAQVTFPACCIDDLEAQYNSGDNGLKVPNLIPDLVTRVAYNPSDAFHLDVGGVMRYFRHTLRALDQDFSQAGGGLGVNLAVKPAPAARLLLQSSYGKGLGRYVGGLVPDVIVRADGSIEPVTTVSWVGGLEVKTSTSTALAGYYSGVSAGDRVASDANGTPIGYGYTGAPDSHNRRIREATGVFTWRVVESDRGSVQFNVQTSWLTRSPWSPRPGLSSADEFMFFSQIRYNLP